ncbi:hypothetical protein DH2020_022494 [Rehmannia glutinosa]|uniref:Uncharacterized protein n=1 Tax=Rehmannia glutinosa TaxID=99300 RepID=A0ABR0WF05_REHGL
MNNRFKTSSATAPMDSSTPPSPETPETVTSTTTTTTIPLSQNPPRRNPSPRPSRLPSIPNPNYPQLAPHVIIHPYLYGRGFPSQSPGRGSAANAPVSSSQQPKLFYSPPNRNYPQLTPRRHLPQDPSQLLYPGTSSGRGLLKNRTNPLSMPAADPSPRPVVFPSLDQGTPGFIRPSYLRHGSGPGSAGNASGGAGVMPGVVKGTPPVSSSHHPKAGLPSSSSIPDNDGHKDLRDDTFAFIRDRKVRISEGASLYSLCRSWLRNGSTEVTQCYLALSVPSCSLILLPTMRPCLIRHEPQYPEAVISLPRPLPAVVDPPDIGAGDDEEDEEEDEENVEHLSAEELLQRQIKRAKKVRARKKEERHQRIQRYRERIALLLHPKVDKSESSDEEKGKSS